MNHPQIVLFMGHHVSAGTRRDFLRLQQGAASLADVCWLYDNRAAAVPDFLHNQRCYPFSPQQIAGLRYTTLKGTMTPGHCHFPLLRFFRDFPNYEYYWLIEYDVHYAGDWSAFFQEFSQDSADFLTSHIRHQHEEPQWRWWHLRHPRQSIPLASRLRSFNPIFRISRRALERLDAELRDGWCGHSEELLPTLLHLHGFRLADLGGSGSFTPPERKGRLYIDAPPDASGRMRGGSMRFHPAFWQPGSRKGLLYHPIKPLPTVLKSWLQEVRLQTRPLRVKARKLCRL